MKRQYIDADASYAALNQGYDLTPPVVASAVGGPLNTGPYAAYCLANTIERFRPGHDMSGNRRHGVFMTPARPGPSCWQLGASDGLALPFSMADVLALTGEATVLALANIAPAVVSRIISSWNNETGASVFATAFAASGTAANMDMGHTDVPSGGAMTYYGNPWNDTGRGSWQIYVFEFSRLQLAGASQAGKLGALAIPPGQSPSAAVEHDSYPVTPITGGTGQLSIGAPIIPDTGITATGGMLLHSLMIYPLGLTPYLEPVGAAALSSVQQFYRGAAAKCGIVI